MTELRPPLEQRSQEPRNRLSALLARPGGATYVRIGDGELLYLLDGDAHKTGLDGIDRERLVRAYANADHVDLCMHYMINRARMHELDITFSDATVVDDATETGGLIRDWTWTHFRDFVSGRHALFVGAEADLVEALFADPEYRRRMAAFWPDDARASFLVPENRGRDPGRAVDRIKAAVLDAVEASGADVVFIALGGPAKIICTEVRDEAGISTIDFGAMLRGLSYSSLRADMVIEDQCPFMAHVPLDAMLRAADRAYPDASVRRRLRFAQAQLRLEVCAREPLTAARAPALDDPEVLRDFEQSLTTYREQFGAGAWLDPRRTGLMLDFALWRSTVGHGGHPGIVRAAARAARRVIALPGRVLRKLA